MCKLRTFMTRKMMCIKLTLKDSYESFNVLNMYALCRLVVEVESEAR